MKNTWPNLGHRLPGRTSFKVIGLLILSTLVATSCQKTSPKTQISRGIRALAVQETRTDEVFEPAQSLGVFIGIEQFTVDQQLATVEYAVDDAVDLAHLFSLELHLMDPERVHLLLSGEPEKEDSRKRLEALEEKGAKRSPANQSTIIALLEREKRSASGEGVFVLSIATHGFNSESDYYLMTEDACLDLVGETGLRVGDLLTRIHQLPFHRQVVLLDACRANLVRERGAPNPQAAISRALLDAIAKAEGQVILTAAREGGYAYSDAERRNGVFTAAILDGLRRGADTDDRGFVTPVTLADFISREVAEWARRNPSISSAPHGIEFALAGAAAKMPLVSCLEKGPDTQIERVGSLQFMDVGSKTPLAHKGGQVILGALHRGIKVSADTDPAIIVDIDRQIPDTPETINKLMDIWFHPELTSDEKYAKTVDDFLDPFSVDVLVTGMFINTGEVIQVSPMMVSRFKRGFRTKHLQFANIEELFDMSAGEPRLTLKAEEEVQGAVQEILGVPLLFVSSSPLVDGIKKSPYDSERGKLIFEAIRSGMDVSVGSVPNIVIDSSRHMIPDSGDKLDQFLNILYDTELNQGAKVRRSVSDLMDPYSIDLLVTAVVIDTESGVQVTFLGVPKRGEAVIHRTLVYLHIGELFASSGGSTSLTSRAQGDIERVMVEMLKESSRSSLSLRRHPAG